MPEFFGATFLTLSINLVKDTPRKAAWHWFESVVLPSSWTESFNTARFQKQWWLTWNLWGPMAQLANLACPVTPCQSCFPFRLIRSSRMEVCWSLACCNSNSEILPWELRRTVAVIEVSVIELGVVIDWSLRCGAWFPLHVQTTSVAARFWHLSQMRLCNEMNAVEIGQAQSYELARDSPSQLAT